MKLVLLLTAVQKGLEVLPAVVAPNREQDPRSVLLPGLDGSPDVVDGPVAGVQGSVGRGLHGVEDDVRGQSRHSIPPLSVVPVLDALQVGVSEVGSDHKVIDLLQVSLPCNVPVDHNRRQCQQGPKQHEKHGASRAHKDACHRGLLHAAAASTLLAILCSLGHHRLAPGRVPPRPDCHFAVDDLCAVIAEFRNDSHGPPTC
mmetsp:Transcript_59847/g.106774  ORF Transcript_59847/g.106774 Transcript_59847/m.106774 type:complete len:201 (+) Transcript_59847:868-1470(+)